MKTKSSVCATLVAMLLSCALISCASVSSAPKESLELYQPRVLRLQARKPVPTRDGTYLPQVDEIWHSDAAYRALERELINTTAALAQSKNSR